MHTRPARNVAEFGMWPPGGCDPPPMVLQRMAQDSMLPLQAAACSHAFHGAADSALGAGVATMLLHTPPAVITQQGSHADGTTHAPSPLLAPAAAIAAVPATAGAVRRVQVYIFPCTNLPVPAHSAPIAAGAATAPTAATALTPSCAPATPHASARSPLPCALGGSQVLPPPLAGWQLAPQSVISRSCSIMGGPLLAAGRQLLGRVATGKQVVDTEERERSAQREQHGRRQHRHAGLHPRPHGRRHPARHACAARTVGRCLSCGGRLGAGGWPQQLWGHKGGHKAGAGQTRGAGAARCPALQHVHLPCAAPMPSAHPPYKHITKAAHLQTQRCRAWTGRRCARRAG